MTAYKVAVNGKEVEVYVGRGNEMQAISGHKDVTAEDVAAAINARLGDVEAVVSVTHGQYIDIKGRPLGPYRVPWHVARAAQRAGIDEAQPESNGSWGWLPAWLYPLHEAGRLGRFGAHPGRYRKRMSFVAGHRDALCAAWRLGGDAAVLEAWAEVRRAR